MEELTENAEEPDEDESKQSVQKLGKLQYKVWGSGGSFQSTRCYNGALLIFSWNTTLIRIAWQLQCIKLKSYPP